VLTVGVEEEFLLLEPGGKVAPVAAEVVRWAGADGQVKTELMAFQLETATRVCTGLDQLYTELAQLRLRAASAANRAGARLIPVGMPPYQAGPLDRVTSEPRYVALTRRYPWAAAVGSACACHVHIGLTDRRLRAQVVARMRPWLPALLALSGNSPIAGGADSGWSSRRYRALLNWPTFRPPGMWQDLDEYEKRVRAAIARGAAADPSSVYFLARLSPRYPTVEVRIADTCLTAADTVLLAAVVRGLVTTLVVEAEQGSRMESMANARVEAELLSVARNATLLQAQRSHRSAAAARLLADLHSKILPALQVNGDAEEVERGLSRIRLTGTGADRQRAMLAATAGRQAFVSSLARVALPATAS
jgi:glutamate---cysteine ligase / carboxylate-amine ligase